MRYMLLITIISVGLLPSRAEAVPIQLLFERDADSGAGTEIFIGTYASYADLLSNTLLSLEASALDINSAFSVGGLTYDGSNYQLLFERDTDSGAGTEVFIGTYASYETVLSNTLLELEASALDINAAFSVGGYSFDGLSYYVLFERNLDSGAGTEVFIGRYASYADVLSNTLASLDASALDVNGAFSIRGMTHLVDFNAVAVPEPSSLGLMSVGLLGLLGFRRSRRLAR